MWDPGTNTAVREVVGPWASVFETVTHLGDGVFLVAVGVVVYWFGRGSLEDRAFVLAVGAAAFALAAGMKGVFQVPRPELVFAPADYPGYGFPSAHALGSAAVYGALAVSLAWGRARWRYLAAAVVIGTVAVSRVVMGVHFVGDVVVGLALGVGLVGVGVVTRDEGRLDPGPLFVLAAVIAVAAALLGSRVSFPLVVSVAVGGVVGWYLVKDRRVTEADAGVLVVGFLLVPAYVVIRGVSWLLGPVHASPYGLLVLAGEFVGYTLLTVFVLAVPWLAIRVERYRPVKAVQNRLPDRDRDRDHDPGSSEVPPGRDRPDLRRE